MYKYFIIILISISSLFSMETVAIIDLEGIGVSEDDARALTQRLTSQMIQIGKYTIVERSEMKRLLDEQKFQYSGCVDVACAVEIGKMLGAKTMVVGSVSKVGTVYSVDARMIDVKSAENYISANYTTAEDIGILLMDGMEFVANQLCEVETKKEKIKPLVYKQDSYSNYKKIQDSSNWGRSNSNFLLYFPNYQTVKKNEHGEIIGSKGWSWFGYYNKSYYKPLRKNNWNPYTYWGTAYVIIPNYGFGTEYVTSSGWKYGIETVFVILPTFTIGKYF